MSVRLEQVVYWRDKGCDLVLSSGISRETTQESYITVNVLDNEDT